MNKSIPIIHGISIFGMVIALLGLNWLNLSTVKQLNERQKQLKKFFNSFLALVGIVSIIVFLITSFIRR